MNNDEHGLVGQGGVAAGGGYYSDEDDDYSEDDDDETRKRSAAARSTKRARSSDADAAGDARRNAVDRKFACPECGVKFSRKHNMQAHLLTHSGEKHFTCSRCGKAFGRVYELRRHEASHVDTRSYVCEHCGAAFTRGDALKRHLKTSKNGKTCTNRPLKKRVASGGRGSLSGDDDDGESPSSSGVANTPPVSSSGTASRPRRSAPVASARSAGSGATATASAPSSSYAPAMTAVANNYAAMAGTQQPPAGYGAPASDGRYAYEYQQSAYPVQPSPAPSHQTGYESYAPSPYYPMAPQAGALFGMPGYGPRATDFDAYGSPGATNNYYPSMYSPVPQPQQAMNSHYGRDPTHDAYYMAAHPQAPVSSAAAAGYRQPQPENPLPEPTRPPAAQVAKPEPALSVKPEPVRADEPLLSTEQTGYPGIPPDLFPDWDAAEKLVELHFHYHSSLHSFIHQPTFMHRMSLRIADANLLLTLMWSGLVMVSHDNEQGERLLSLFDEKKMGDTCLERLQDEAAKILAEVQYQSVDPDRVVTLLQALLMARTVLIGKAFPLDNNLHTLVNQLHPYAKLGMLPGDSVRRDPRDLGAWIWAEERARLSMLTILSDTAISDVTGTLPKWLPNKGRLERFRDPSQPGSSAIEPGSAGHDPYPWLDLCMPCPDGVFEGLPPVPVSQADYELWRARDEAQSGILDHVKLHTVREIVSWMDLVPGSQERRRVVDYAVGGILKHGVSFFLVVFSDLYARTIVCRDFFSKNGFKLYDPPQGDSAEEKEARLLRSNAVLGLDDFFKALPEEIQKLDELADGAGLRELAGRWWGKQRASRLTHCLIFLHSLDLILHTPRDLLEEYEVPDPSWPSSDAFVKAEANAIIISRLMRSLLSMPTVDALGLPLDPEEYRKLMAEEAKNLPPIWSVAVLRAAWVHCVAIRRFKDMLGQSQLLEVQQTEQAMKTMNELVTDIQGCLGGMAECGTVWKNTYQNYVIMSGAVERLMKDESGENAGPLLTKEEIAMLKTQMQAS